MALQTISGDENKDLIFTEPKKTPTCAESKPMKHQYASLYWASCHMQTSATSFWTELLHFQSTHHNNKSPIGREKFQDQQSSPTPVSVAWVNVYENLFKGCICTSSIDFGKQVWALKA